MNDDEKLASESAGEMQPVLRALDIEENSQEVESDASSRRTQLFVLIGTCGLGFFVADVLTAMFFKEALPALLTLGIVTAQLTVICVWGTLVRGTFWIRLPWTLLLLVVSWFGLGLGASYVDRNFNSNVALGIGMVWMLGFVTSYIPLKIAAIGFRWEIVRESVNNQNKPDTRRYAIRDMMLGTLLLAINACNWTCHAFQRRDQPCSRIKGQWTGSFRTHYRAYDLWGCQSTCEVALYLDCTGRKAGSNQVKNWGLGGVLLGAIDP